MAERRDRSALRLVGAVAAAGVLAACSTTGEPVQTAAVAVRQVTAEGLTQTVVPAVDGFDRVTVHTATYGEVDGVDGTLVLDIRAGDETRTTAAAGADLVDNAPITLTFDPIDGSGGETVELTFTYAGQEPVALYVNPHDGYLDGELTPGGGDLTFSLGHRDRVGGALDAAGRVVAETTDKATGDPAFLVVWLVALAGAGVVWHRSRA